MIVEVIAVGTELLLGQITNTNAAVIGAALADRGMDAHYQQVVGDNLERTVSAIRAALDRADAVIITGGIGPTQDDMTREALCAATGREMVFSETYADYLRSWWSARGRMMPESNLRQAEHPAGAELLPNPKGTAPGIALEHEGRHVFCVPGVPAEMEHLLHAEVLPRLVAEEGVAVVASRVLRTWGLPESELAERLDDLFTASANPSIAFLATSGEIRVRVTAKAPSRVEAERMISPVEEEVRRLLGEVVYAVDDVTIERVVLELLVERGWTIGTAESMTGGLVAAALTTLPGSSAVFRGGLVAYDPDLKRKLLGVADVTEVVTLEVAEQMAHGGRTLLGTDVCVSVTGSAGPEALERPPGTMVIGVSTPEATMARELRMVGDRERVRAYGTTAALHHTRLALTGRWW
ncbi:MAG: competence/damage-inducible protein A [Actinobacteria bacterium]|nr:competence/damage-inducible protein A [Actinomycetota bacterium]